MNHRFLFNRYTGLAGSLALVATIAAGCGSDSKGGKGGNGDAGGGDGGAETDGGDGSGGSSGSGGSGTDGGGDGGTGAVDGGTGGAPPTPNDNPDDLIAAICDWEFRCCERGELDFRLGPTIADAEACTDRFVFELRESNDSDNPFESGSAVGLLGQLAFNIDLSRVDIDPDGLGECIAQWESLDCAEDPPDPAPRCDGPGSANPCALDNIFTPKLQQGDLCTNLNGLTEGATNDIECVAGTTCLPGNHADNPGENAACISRRVEGQPCSDDSKCDFGFYCSTDDGNCHEKGDAGDDCTFEDPDEPAPGEEDASCKAGLACNPETLKCVEACTAGFVCAADSQCPAGQSCIPLTVENDTTSWKVCAPVGNSASDRCDTHEDCVENNYCDDVCRPDVGIGDTCVASTHAMCPDGTYCALDPLLLTHSCELLGGPGDTCASSAGCEAGAKECIFDDTGLSRECSATKRPNGEGCTVDGDCRSGICDYPTTAAVSLECIAGADEGDDCDNGTAVIGTDPRCGAGLACIEAICVTQVAPGADCENDEGAATNALCQNNQCDTQWERIMCTDGPIPESNGGTGLTCDGTDN